MKKILVPTDFTQGALNAYEYALRLANTLDAKVTLYHVYSSEEGNNHRPRSLTEALIAKEESLALEALAGYGYSVQQSIGLEVESDYILDQGRPIKSIVEYAEFMAADLIVMGTWWAKGASGVVDTWWGNVATRVIEKSNRPILLVPEDVRYEPINHLVYATNFREEDQRIPKEIQGLNQSRKVKISVLNIRRSEPAYDPIYFAFLKQIYQLEMDNFNVQFYAINDEDVIQGLNTFVEKEQVQIIVLLTHDRLTIFDRLLGPSLSQQMAFRSKKPLLIVHQDFEA